MPSFCQLGIIYIYVQNKIISLNYDAFSQKVSLILTPLNPKTRLTQINTPQKLIHIAKYYDCFFFYCIELHTVSSQNFRSFCFLPFFLLFYLSKIVQLILFREIATYTSRLLSFDKFLKKISTF